MNRLTPILHAKPPQNRTGCKHKRSLPFSEQPLTNNKKYLDVKNRPDTHLISDHITLVPPNAG